MKPSKVETDKPERARQLLRPSVSAGLSVDAWRVTGKDRLHDELIAEIDATARAVKAGDMTAVESLLVGQMLTLDAIFHRLIQQSGEYGRASETLGAALKTQAAARSTVQTLAMLKAPATVSYVHGDQTNIAALQVNHTQSETAPNKLLEQTYGERLDTITPQIAGREDHEMVAVEALDRA